MVFKVIPIAGPATIALILLLSSGCSGRRQSVVGTWSVQGGPTAATMTFQADGNFKTEASAAGRRSTVTGQYQQQGDKVVFKTMSARTATIQWKSNDEMVMTGDDGVSMTLVRQK